MCAHLSSWLGRRPWMDEQPQAGRFVRVDVSHAVLRPRSTGMDVADAEPLLLRPLERPSHLGWQLAMSRGSRSMKGDALRQKPKF